MYTTDHNSNMQSLCRIIRCVVFIYAQWEFCPDYSSHPFAFYCAMCTTSLWERGIGEGTLEADGCAVGRSALLKLLQGWCCWCDLFWKRSWKHTHISKIVSCGAWSPGGIYFPGCTLGCIACQRQRSPLPPCISKGIRGSIFSPLLLVFWKIEEASVYPEWTCLYCEECFDHFKTVKCQWVIRTENPKMKTTLSSSIWPFWYYLSLRRAFALILNELKKEKTSEHWIPKSKCRCNGLIQCSMMAHPGVSSSVALLFSAGLFTCRLGHWSCMACRHWFLTMQWWEKSLAQYKNLLVSCRNVFLYKQKGSAVFNKYVIHPPLPPKPPPCLLWVTLYTDTKKTALLKPVKVGTFINPHWDPVFTV